MENQKKKNDVDAVIKDCYAVLDGIRSDAAAKSVLDWCNTIRNAKSQNDINAAYKNFNTSINEVFKAHRR